MTRKFDVEGKRRDGAISGRKRQMQRDLSSLGQT